MTTNSNGNGHSGQGNGATTNGASTTGPASPHPDPAVAGRYFDMVANVMSARSNMFQKLFDPRRSIDDECGYPASEMSAWGATAIDPDFYRNLYDREAIATRVVEVIPRECWQVTPLVYEDEDPDNVTEFEAAWDELGQQLRGEQCWYQDEEGSPIWEILRRADVLSGIGHFGILLLGLDDGSPLDTPAPNIAVVPRGTAAPDTSATDDSPSGDSQSGDRASLPHGSTDLYGPATAPNRTGTTPVGNVHQGAHPAGPVGAAVLSPPPPGARYYDLTSNAWSCPGKEAEDYPVYEPDPKTGLPRLARRQRYPDSLSLNSQQAGAVFDGMPADSVVSDDHRTVPMGGGPAGPLGANDGVLGNAEPGQLPGSEGPTSNYAPTTPTTSAPNPYGGSPATSGYTDAWSSYAGSYLGTDAQYQGTQLSPGGAPPTLAPGQRTRLLFLRAFDESLVQVVQYEANPLNPRYGQPIMYRVTLNDPRELHSGIGLPLATVRVHWSRVIHLTDHHHTAGSSEVFSAPRMRPVLNRLLDLRKLYAGSAEGYWRAGCMPMTVFETVPQLGGDVRIDFGSIRDMMEQAENGMQKWIALMGMQAKTLAPAVTDPASQINVQIEAICIKLGMPVRIFKGSERGELASAQDDSSWNDRLRERNLGYTTPRIIVPLIDRLISLGVLPEPGRGKRKPDKEKTWLSGGAKPPEGEPGADGGPGAGGPPGEGEDTDLAKPPSLKPPQAEAKVNPFAGGSPKSSFGKPGGPSANRRRGRARGRPALNAVAPNVYGPDRRGRFRTRTSSGRVLILNAEGKPVGVETKGGYSVEWPDLDSLGQKDKAAIALQQAQTLGAFIQGSCETMMTPMDFYTRVMQFDEEEAQAIIDNIMAAHEEADTMTIPPQVEGRPAAPAEGTQEYEDQQRQQEMMEAQQEEDARRFDATTDLKEKSLDKGLAAFGSAPPGMSPEDEGGGPGGDFGGDGGDTGDGPPVSGGGGRPPLPRGRGKRPPVGNAAPDRMDPLDAEWMLRSAME